MNIIYKVGLLTFLSSVLIPVNGQENQVNPRKINTPYERTKPLITYEGEIVVVTPAHSTGPIINPGKGWVGYGTPANQPAEVLNMVSMGYTRYSWGSIEPEEGKFNWDRIDNDIKAWADSGKTFAFGIMGASTHSRDFWVTPKWVFDAGAKYDTFNLNDPKLATTGIPGLKLVPAFNDRIYIEKLKKFINALAERYDGNPDIAFIDIRSYGNWGEAHMHPFGKPELTPDEFKKHIQIHRDAFKKTLLVVPGGKKEYNELFDWAVSVGVGMRRDGILGNSNGSETARCDGKMPGVFEFFGNYEMMVERGWWYGKGEKGYGYRLDECVERGKPSYCDLSRGGKSGLNMMKSEPVLVNELTNRIGYHFVLLEAKYPKVLSKAKPAGLSLTWENRGVAYIFIPVKVSYALLTKAGKVADICDATASIPSKWKSDTPVMVTDNVSFRNAPKGDYILTVGIRRPFDDMKPSVKIGIEQKSYDGWYELGPVKIK
jgi:hypothetical protein